MKQSNTLKFVIFIILLVSAIHSSNALNLISPDDNAWLNNNNVTFAFTTELSDANCSLIVNNETLQRQEIINSTNDSINYFVQELNEGIYSWKIACVNYNLTNNITSNITDESLHRNLNIDTTAPDVILNSPYNDFIFNTNNVTLVFTAIDNLSINLSCSILITSKNTTATINNINTTSNTSKAVLIQNMNNIVYNWSVTCNDSAGNTNQSETRSFTVSAGDELFFDIILNKDSFNLGESGTFTIIANNLSSVYIEIHTPVYNYFWNYINQSFPITEHLPYTNKTGNYYIYGVIEYKNQSKTINKSFEVENTLSIHVEGDTRILKGDSTVLAATATGGIGNIRYVWTLYDGTIVNNALVNLSYTNPGRYSNNITVYDAESNSAWQMVDVVVKELLDVKFKVEDLSGGVIQNAIVEIESEEGFTDSNGEIIFYLTDGMYSIRVSKDGYRPSNQNVRVNNESKNFTIRIDSVDLSAPVVQLLTKTDSLLGNPVSLKFEATDTTSMNCSLYIAKENDNWYSLMGNIDSVVSNTEYEFKVNYLELGKYKWKVECVDANKNSGFSEERMFNVTNETSGSVEPAIELSDADKDTFMDFQNSMNAYYSMGLEEKEVADDMDFTGSIDRGVRDIERARRDISGLDNRRDLSDQEIENEKAKLEKRIEDIKYTTPVNLKVLESKTYVKYVKDPELKSIISDYNSVQTIPLNEKGLIDTNKELQSLFTVSTKARIVELSYLNGETKTITLITRSMKYEGNSSSDKDIFILESIPKEIAQSSNELTILGDYEILKQDPLIKFTLVEKIVYYITKSVPLSDTENIDTVLFSPKITINVKSGLGLITGASIISLPKLDLKTILIALITILILIYLLFILHGLEKLKMIYIRLFSEKQVHYITVLINDAYDYLDAEEYDDAVYIYREIKLAYEELSDVLKAQIFENILELCNKLDLYYLNQVMDKVDTFLRTQQYDKAAAEYNKLDGTYKKIEEKYKKNIYDRAEILFKKLNEIMQK